MRIVDYGLSGINQVAVLSLSIAETSKVLSMLEPSYSRLTNYAIKVYKLTKYTFLMLVE